MPHTVSISLPVPGARSAWLAVGLVAGMLVAIVGGPLLAIRPIGAADPTSSGDTEHTISVTGTGRVVLTPDTADVRIGVSVTAGTVKVARGRAAEAMTAVIASLRSAGIAEKDIQTATLSLQPTYDYSSQTTPPRVTGYNLTNVVAVTVRNLDVLGDAIDGAMAAGATSLDGVSFRVEDQAAAERQARQAAMAEAEAKAKTLADAAHVSISGVSSISESVAPVSYPIYYGEMAGAKDVATPVLAGTTEVSVTVAVVYLIG
jgi:uncharacterized protein YggE